MCDGLLARKASIQPYMALEYAETQHLKRHDTPNDEPQSLHRRVLPGYVPSYVVVQKGTNLYAKLAAIPLKNSTMY